MPAETDNFGGLALSGALLIVFGMVRLFALWVRNAPAPPDPWGPEVEATLREWQTPETCPRCSTGPRSEERSRSPDVADAGNLSALLDATRLERVVLSALRHGRRAVQQRHAIS